RLLRSRPRTGGEMRATVDDRALAGLTGADPLRANRVAWVLGTQLAAVGGILIAPDGAHAGCHPALVADRQRLHRAGERHRQAAQPADDVRRRGVGRPPGELPDRLPAGQLLPAGTAAGRTGPAAADGPAGVPARPAGTRPSAA